MNNGLRYISENGSQDLVYCFPLEEKQENPFQKNSADQENNQQIIKSSFIAKVLGIIGCLFGIIFMILTIQGQNSMLQEYLFNVKTLKITRVSFFFCFILLAVIISIFIYQLKFKKVNLQIKKDSKPIQNSFNIIDYIHYFIYRFSYYFKLFSFHLFKKWISTLCLFIINVVLAIYVQLKKQDYQPTKYSIYSIILNCIFSFISILYFIDIWWNLLICGISIMLFELLIIHSAKMILEQLNLNLTEKDYIISVPIIFCLSLVLFLALILLIIIVVLLLCKSKNSEGQDDDEDDDES
ncbi:unnamed protein product [Paramecium primaurelia]|uniref:Transmembrane protein n=1 Tax=Paramecium primaurelia TaxID=5886 RepID=A0A8S1KY17_PARPR|nr:unnamed protein product [Paramecium primaurelia]